jgi:RHS repeat-associated protein
MAAGDLGLSYSFDHATIQRQASMNWVSTCTYDDLTVRWTLPDPAEQFHNPYLAMGNNPVVYVDPDGEFILTALALIAAPFTAGASLTLLPYTIGADIGAYAGGAMANDHMNPLKWDFNSANTWIGMGGGAAIGAAGGHGFLAKKGAIQGMSTTAGKKLFGGIIGGTTNTISNYDGADSFGWGMLGDFAAGFGGAYAGISANSVAAGFNAGGFLNATNNIIQDGFGSAYEFAQDWVGGGLSSIVGMSYGGVKAKGIFAGETKLGKYANSFIGYGSQATMYDFAYSSQSTFTGRSFGEHLGTFAAGGFYGSLSAEAFKGKWGGGDLNETPKFWRALTGATAFATDYSIGALIKGRTYGNFYNGQSQKNKGGIFSLKYLAFSLNYLGY